VNAGGRELHPVEQLSCYVDGELDAEAQAAVDRHLASCSDCRELLSDLTLIATTIERSDDVPAPPPDLARRIGRQVARETERRPARIGRWNRPWMLAAAASVMLVAVVSVLLRTELATAPSLTRETSQAEALEKNAAADRTVSLDDQQAAGPAAPSAPQEVAVPERTRDLGVADEADGPPAISTGRAAPSADERRDLRGEDAVRPTGESVVEKEEQRKRVQAKRAAADPVVADDRIREEFSAAPDAAAGADVGQRAFEAPPASPEQEAKSGGEGRLAERENAFLESVAMQRQAGATTAPPCGALSILPEDAVSTWRTDRDEEVRREIELAAARLEGRAQRQADGGLAVTVPVNRWDELRAWYAAARGQEDEELPLLTEQDLKSADCVRVTIRVAPRLR